MQLISTLKAQKYLAAKYTRLPLTCPNFFEYSSNLIHSLGRDLTRNNIVVQLYKGNLSC